MRTESVGRDRGLNIIWGIIMLSCCSSCLSPSRSQSNLLRNNISAASNGGGKVYQQNPVVSSLGFLNCRSRPLFNRGGGGETRRRRGAVVAVRREREWEEYYEEAVKEKDLVLALRLLKQQEEEEEEEKNSSSSSIESTMMMIPQLRERESSSEKNRDRDWEILDTCLNADDMSLVSSAYSFLHHRGFLPFFGKFRNLVLEGPRDVTPTLLKSSTGLDVSKLSPKKWGLSGTSTFLLPALLASVSFLLNQGLDIRPQLAAILALAIIDSIFLGGSCLAQISTYWPPYRRRVLVHEAGHLLIAYLLGCPIRGVILDPIVAMQMGIQGQAGTQFWDEKLQNELAEGRLSGTSFDRYCMVLFAGIAAEAFVYGEAEGGENDENLFRSICILLEPPLSVAQMSNQARWSVLQSYNMLKWHKHAHRAAVKALETGGSLSFVIRKMEEAMLCTTT